MLLGGAICCCNAARPGGQSAIRAPGLTRRGGRAGGSGSCVGPGSVLEGSRADVGAVRVDQHGVVERDVVAEFDWEVVAVGCAEILDGVAECIIPGFEPV